MQRRLTILKALTGRSDDLIKMEYPAVIRRELDMLPMWHDQRFSRGHTSKALIFAMLMLLMQAGAIQIARTVTV